jgi:hypothetical protein
MAGDYQFLYGSSNASNAAGVTPHPYRRVSVSNDVFLPDHVWNTRTGRVVSQKQPETKRPHAQATSIGFHQTIEKEARQKSVRSGQMDLNKALVIAMALFVILGMFTLSNRSTLLDMGEKLRIAYRGIEQLTADNADLRGQIDEATQEAGIGYRAANELGMIRATDAQTIPLIAVDAYPVESAQPGYTAEVVVDGWGTEQTTGLTLSANAE